MDNGRNWNHSHSHPHFRENGGAYVIPVENTAVVSRGANNLAYLNMPLRPNNHQPFGPDIHNYREADRYLHPGGLTRPPPIYAQHHIPPPYDQLRIGGMSSSVPHMDIRRAPLKRKTPDYSMAFGAESSSNPWMPSNPQCWPNDLVYGRNVRSRHGNSLYPEIGSYEIRPLINQSHTPVFADLHSRGSFGNEVNRPIPSSSTEVYGGYHHSNSRNPMATRYAPLDLGGQRPSPSYRSIIPSHRYGESDSRRPGIVNPRHSRPTPTIAHSSQRTQQVSYGNNRWMPEAVIVIDPSPFYGSASLFNQHHEIGLDIDNMSYEELLALEERIGNVSTGLCEDAISNCLTEMTYCSDGENENCVICLEKYEDKDNVWRLKCKHDFHFICIKKWLTMKNVCPICKASASEDAVTKEKQVVSPGLNS